MQPRMRRLGRPRAWTNKCACTTQPAARLVVALPGRDSSRASSPSFATPPSERGPLLFALALAVAALLVLAAALSGRFGSGSDLPARPSLGPAASVPSPSAAQAASVVERAA